MKSKLPKPSVPKKVLYFISGTLWSIAAIILIERAYIWLSDYGIEQLIFVIGLGVILAIIFYFSVFRKIVQKNINRIKSLPDSVCIFAFTAWKGYFIIAIMVIAGIILRHSAFSKHYLAVLYLAMGGSLLIGSILFYTKFKISKRK
ncbi:MAG: hypothetical protein QME52_03210 [Bacteroidota bacterium]|nr:hypothetical protein [Bacteroidota bacterium]